MVTFGKFSEIIDDQKGLRECASLIAELDIDAASIVESVLEEELVEDWRGWLGGAGKALKAAGQVAGSVVSGGLKHGVAQASDTLSGPAVKFDKAVAILKDLEQYLRKNPATANVASSSNPKRSIAGYIQSIYKALEKESGNMPKMLDASKQVAAGGQYGLRGNSPEFVKSQAMRQSQNQAQRQNAAQPLANGNQQADQTPQPMKIAQ